MPLLFQAVNNPYYINYWRYIEMITEVNRATLFLLTMMRSKERLSKEEVVSLRDALVAVMVARYNNHWHPKDPHRGSAYRCIRLIHESVDPVISAVGHITGLTGEKLRSWLPLEFTLWVDPNEVSYRIGENGSVMAVYVPDIESMVDYIPDPLPELDSSRLDEPCKNPHRNVRGLLLDDLLNTSKQIEPTFSCSPIVNHSFWNGTAFDDTLKNVSKIPQSSSA